MHRIHQRLLPDCDRRIAMGLTLVMLTFVGCQGQRTQSSLHPAGPAADSVATLWWILLAVLGIYSLAVFVLTLVAIFRSGNGNGDEQNRDDRPPQEGRLFILVGGVVLPAIILVPLLIYSLTTTANLRMREGGLTIRVEGHMWWWAVEYTEQGVITANELTIPAGEPVRLELTSADVIHSFWVPQLHGKMDLLPGQISEFWIEADRPGRYRGQCAEYCGRQHALMAFEVVALPPEEFVEWLRTHSTPAPTSTAQSSTAQRSTAPRSTTQQQLSSPQASSALERDRGKRLFFQHGCGVCHAIKGTPAQGLAGPDLTWIANRNTLAAGTIVNTRENLMHWLVDPQSIKPGAKMPPTHAPREQLELIVNYLHSLAETK